MSVSISVRMPDISVRNMICSDDVTPAEVLRCLGITDFNNYIIFFDGFMLNNGADLNYRCAEILNIHGFCCYFDFSFNHLMRVCSINDYERCITPFGVNDEVVVTVPPCSEMWNASRIFISGFYSEMETRSGCVATISDITKDTRRGRRDLLLWFRDGYSTWWDSMWVDPYKSKSITDDDFEAMIEEVYEVER